MFAFVLSEIRVEIKQYYVCLGSRAKLGVMMIFNKSEHIKHSFM